MSRFVTVMEHYASDIEIVLVPPPKGRRQGMRGAWPRASIEVHDAIQNAARYLTLTQAAARHSRGPHAAGPANAVARLSTRGLLSRRDQT